MYKRKHKMRVRESVIVILAIHRWTRRRSLKIPIFLVDDNKKQQKIIVIIYISYISTIYIILVIKV